jgi:hypothetical protein
VTSHDDRLVSKPTLAIIKNALVELCSHSELVNLFEQYDFEADPRKPIPNKLGRTAAHLDGEDWADRVVVKRLLDLVTHVFIQLKSRSFHEDPIPRNEACQRIIKALNERESFDWDGERFVSKKSATLLHVADTVQSFNLDSVHREVERLLANVDSDPDDVLTSAKCLIESVCRAILEGTGQQPTSHAPEFGQLTKQTFGVLRLLPDQVSNQSKGSEVIKRILQNMGSALAGLAELRNLYGDAHGKGPGSKGLEPRHARLAAGLAGSLASFILETHQKQQSGKTK